MMVQEICSYSQTACSVLRLFPGSANGLHQIGLRDGFTAREVTSSDLCIDLDTGVGR